MENHTKTGPWRQYLFVFRAICNVILLPLSIPWIEVRAHFYPSVDKAQSTDSIEPKLGDLNN